jgi:hypothetical protein
VFYGGSISYTGLSSTNRYLVLSDEPETLPVIATQSRNLCKKQFTIPSSGVLPVRVWLWHVKGENPAAYIRIAVSNEGSASISVQNQRHIYRVLGNTNYIVAGQCMAKLQMNEEWLSIAASPTIAAQSEVVLADYPMSATYPFTCATHEFNVVGAPGTTVGIRTIAGSGASTTPLFSADCVGTDPLPLIDKHYRGAWPKSDVQFQLSPVTAVSKLNTTNQIGFGLFEDGGVEAAEFPAGSVCAPKQSKENDGLYGVVLDYRLSVTTAESSGMYVWLNFVARDNGGAFSGAVEIARKNGTNWDILFSGGIPIMRYSGQYGLPKGTAMRSISETTLLQGQTVEYRVRVIVAGGSTNPVNLQVYGLGKKVKPGVP